LPKELCVCDKLKTDEEKIIISTDRRKWGKVVTLINFQKGSGVDLTDLLKKAKKKVAAGGTVRGNAIELQGDHRFMIKGLLKNLGYPEENIEFQETVVSQEK